jgi:hypothetical protein
MPNTSRVRIVPVPVKPTSAAKPMDVGRAVLLQGSLFDAVRCRDAIAVSAHGEYGF